ncbi:MAG: helix-turn-helix domain-containing protein [Planctomycetota bacterium]
MADESDHPGTAEQAAGQPLEAAGQLPRVTLDPADGEEAAVAWRESVAPIFETAPVGDEPAFRAGFTGYLVDGLVFSRNYFSPSTYQRSSAHLRGSDQDYITLHLPLSGGERGHLGDQTHVMDPGRVTLADWAHPFSTVSETVDKLGVVIPRTRVPKAVLLYERRPAIHWELDTPTGRLFSGAMMSIWEQLPGASATEGRDLAQALLGLLDGMIGAAFGGHSPIQGEHATGHLLAAMKAYLIRHHDDPDLGPDRLAEAFGCSRSTVYRLFREENGVKAYLRRQRLQRCFETIKSGRSEPQEILAMWSRYGFNSSGHFRRAFQEAYGLTPRDLAEAVERPGPLARLTDLEGAHHRRSVDEMLRWLTD